MLTWSAASNGETFYLFGLWEISKLDTKGAMDGGSHIPFQAGTPKLARLMAPDGHEQWYGTVPHEQESCAPPAMATSCH